MKVLVLITWTDCENKYKSLEAVGHEVHTIQYDNMPHSQHGSIVDRARMLSPDFIVHIGAVEQYHGRPVPQPNIFRALREVAPIILMCNDAGDPPWWPLLDEYIREDCFTTLVSIDGSVDNPIARVDNGILELTPVDHRVFHPREWDARDINLGMVGGIGHTARAATANRLMDAGALTFHNGPVGRTYAEMAEIMCRTKVTFNYGCTGSGQRQHVKGRVVEAGFAGSALFELEGSPACNWLRPGVDYLEYRDADHLMGVLSATSDRILRASASLLNRRIMVKHHPVMFWDRVLSKAGVIK